MKCSTVLGQIGKIFDIRWESCLAAWKMIQVGALGGFGGRLTEWFRDTDQCNLRCWLGPFGRREILGRVYHDGTCLGH